MLLSPVISKLAGKRVVLASASPRRQDILSNVGLRFEVVPSWFKETLDKSLFSAPHEYAVETAKQKALEVARRMHLKHLKTPDIVIGADTIVTLEGAILEKPLDKQDAYNMLSRLSGKEHSVFTGVVIVHCKSEDNQLATNITDFYEETKVKFANLSDELLWEYIDSGEPLDKAGGYGIQSLGGMLVECVHGDFLNVVGFPLNHFCKKLAEIYYPPSKSTIHRVKHDSIPYVESFENLSDVETDCSNQTVMRRANKGSEETCGHSQCNKSVDSSQQHPAVRQNGILEKTREDSKVPSKILDLLDGFKSSKALFVASKLKVFDKLKEKGALKAVEIADMINASVRGTERILDACVALGLLERTHQEYRNTKDANTFLASDGEFSLHGYINYSNDHLWPMFSHLESAVREETCHREKASQKISENSPHDSVHCFSKNRKPFMNAMHEMLKITAQDLGSAFDLSKYGSACDLGGCTGAFAHELVCLYPNMSINVFDLPEVIEHTPEFQNACMDTSRVTFTSGDFFEDKLPRAELYILSRIVHHLSDEQLNCILRKISDNCHKGQGALLLAEIVLDEDRKEPRGLLQSLSMSEGEQRSSAEYRKLLEKFGFNNVEIKITGNLLDAILATKR